MSKSTDSNGLVFDLFGRFRDLANRRSERILIAISAVFFCGVDEFLALGARVFRFGFWLRHRLSRGHRLKSHITGKPPFKVIQIEVTEAGSGGASVSAAALIPGPASGPPIGDLGVAEKASLLARHSGPHTIGHQKRRGDGIQRRDRPSERLESYGIGDQQGRRSSYQLRRHRVPCEQTVSLAGRARASSCHRSGSNAVGLACNWLRVFICLLTCREVRHG